LSDVHVGSYFEADVKLSWQVTRNLELSLNGSNLVHSFHAEASEPPIHQIPRNYYFGVRWSF
jgi:outer membrane receptor for monomeric catechols